LTFPRDPPRSAAESEVIMNMPKPTKQHEKLHQLAGTWLGEEKMHPSEWSPGGTAKGKYVMRVDIDGFFVIQDYEQERDGQITYRGHGIHSWDDKQRTYVWYWVDSMGSIPETPARGQWQGNTLTLEQSGDHMGRYTHEFIGNDRILFKIENSPDGGKTWTTFMQGDYRRA
jgi:hypothetical protein